MFTKIWSKIELLQIRILIIVWLFSVVAFFIWWFKLNHVGYLSGFILMSFAMIWTLCVPGYSFFFLSRMKRLHPSVKFPKSLRVAMIVTKAPSEPLNVVIETLKGSLSQKYPHDTWVADEHPTEEALRWYEDNGVFISCRKDHPLYHNDSWPRRKKCKEGNLSYFYDRYGYDNYDIVVQLDADHIPQEGYLEHMVQPFSNPKIGYVAAPSICDLNKHLSWGARARLQAEAMFHGPIQAGSNDGWVPTCIGSHYAIRTSALREIGGIGPELAEDYSTTILMNAYGYDGVWAPDANARGEGANSFADLIVQDYQWARSMFILLLTIYPKLSIRMNWRQNFRFIFGQLWYPLSALTWLIVAVAPISALVIGFGPVNVKLSEFLVRGAVPYVLSLFIFIFVYNKGHLRPQKTKLISWENALFELARWPWVIIASFDAIKSVITKTRHTFRVTPKGGKVSNDKLPFKIITPYLILIALSLTVFILTPFNSNLKWYYIFSQIVLWSYIILIFMVTILHIKESNQKNKLKIIKQHISHLTLPLTLVIVFMFITNQGLQLKKIINIHKDIVSNEEGILAVIEEAPFKDAPIKVSYRHVVTEGESLWSISRKYYGKGADWDRIIVENKSNNLSPKEVLYIPTDL